MSNRSLFEINHDYSHAIKTDAVGFLLALDRYLRSASPEKADDLERYGVRVFGMRHHSEGFTVRWGTHANQIIETPSTSQ